MVKIVILVAIVMLACVNAQMNFPFPGFPTGGVFDMFKNFKIPTPEEIINKEAGPNQNFQAHYVSSDISKDGKMRTSVLHNNNGEKTGYTMTN